MPTPETKTEIQEAQVRFLASTERLLEAADDVRRDREDLFRVLGRSNRAKRRNHREATACQ